MRPARSAALSWYQLKRDLDAEKSEATKDKQSEDMRSRNTEVAHPAVKRIRKTVGRGMVNLCADLIVHLSIQISVDITDTFFRAFQHRQRVDRCCGLFDEDSGTASVHNQTTAQLRDLVHNLSLEQLKYQELLNSFKSAFNQRMESLELSIAYAHNSQRSLISAQQRYYLQLIKSRDRDLDVLSSELTSTRLLQLDEVRNSLFDVNSSLASLSSQLAEVFAHIRRKTAQNVQLSILDVILSDQCNQSCAYSLTKLSDAIFGLKEHIKHLVSVVAFLGVLAACGLSNRVRV
ncbi:myosin-9 [Dorcoceras hygrometricum]|uniref:Myosin-9 n=1 Tax=Dorcoceras hygrometricum TaxID=472368 RepID=A0A2Z7D446_9LAMI|nr:myosin-9 [Dorcoceras hygrometricum]